MNSAAVAEAILHTILLLADRYREAKEGKIDPSATILEIDLFRARLLKIDEQHKAELREKFRTGGEDE